MEFEEARRLILDLLQQKGKAKNSEMIDSLGGDTKLFDLIREDLIFNDLAEDKKGVGLIYRGPDQEKTNGIPVKEPTEETPNLSEPQEEISPAAQPGSKKIFISYGRADAEELAFRLYDALLEKGHKVWLDKHHMKSGRSWEEQIELEILGCEVFISLLSPHAVRRPEGVCLDEISMARFNRKKIIPAMVVQCRPPLGIYRLDWVDFQNWQQPASYDKALNRLLDTIESDGEGVEGIHARIFSNLRPLDFSLEICRHLKDFTGRAWLDAELEHWLSREESRVFFITGDPGSGKTAMIAHLINTHPQVAAYHFCLFNLRDSLEPLHFVRSIAAQLATQLDGYRSALEALDLERIDEEDPGTLLRRLIADPLKAVTPEGPVLLLVDALDEAYAFGDRNIVKVLHERLADLPSWLRLVLTSRKEPAILDLFKRYHPHEMEADREDNLQDISDYILRRFKAPALSALLLMKNIEPSRLANIITQKGRGNFLYVVQALEAIESGQIDPHDPESFPDGLVEMYRVFFERVFPQGRGYQEIRPILDCIIAAREPLTSEQLAIFLKRSSFDIERELEKLASYFPERDRKYAVYHKSLSDWLNGDAGQSRLFRVDLRNGHTLIAESLLHAYREGQKNPFTLAHLPYHLTEAGRWSDLEAVLCDLRFIESKCAEGMTYDLVVDYKTAIDSLPEAQEGKKKEEEQQARIRRYTEEIIAYASRWNEARRLHGEDPERYPMPEDGDIPFPEIPQSVRLWTEEEIRKDTERIIKNPGRLDRICAFSQFVNSQSHFLVRFASHPGFCVQQAYNSARSGPVADMARELIKGNTKDVMILRYGSSLNEYNPNPALLKTIEGHNYKVTSVSITPDGKRAISGSFDTIKIWDIERGECLKTLEGRTDVFSMSITPDGKRAISGSGDDTLKIWDIEGGECLKALEAHHIIGAINVSITPDGKRAISGSGGGGDGTLKIWDIERGECLKTFKGHDNFVSSVSITPDGKRAISGSGDNTLKIWDIERGECLKTLERQRPYVTSVSITPDGKRAISGSDGGGDGTLKIWDIERGECLKTLEGHHGPVTGVSMTPDGKRVISGSKDGTLKIWDIECGECLKTFEGHNDAVTSVSITPDGKRVISGSYYEIKIWDIECGECLKTLESHNFSVGSVNVTPDGKRAISRSYYEIKIWDIECGECLKTLNDNDLGNILSMTPDGKRVISGSKDGTLKIWDIECGECLKTLKDDGFDNILSITPDGKRAISRSDDKTLKIWDIECGECLKTLEGHNFSVGSVDVTPDGKRAISRSYYEIKIWDIECGECLKTLKDDGFDNILSITPDGKRAISRSDDTTLKIWDIECGECLKTLEGHRSRVISVTITPDGKRAISGSEDETLKIWDIECGECLKTLDGHGSRVTSVSFTPDGKRAISGSEYGTLKIWDIECGECLKTLQRQTESAFRVDIIPVLSVSITPDGKRAISGSGDGTLKIWDIECGECLITLEGHHGPVTGMSITPDGKRAISKSDDNTFKIWDIDCGECLKTLERHRSRVTSVSLTPDGKRAISRSDYELKMWDIECGECLKTLERHNHKVNSVSITPDGKRAISGSGDGTLKIWDIENGECLKTLKDDGFDNILSITPDGKRAISASWYKTIKIWDIERGECLKTFEGHSESVESVIITPDGKRAISASWDKTIKIWDIERGECLKTLEGHTSIVKSFIITPDGKRAVSAGWDNTLRVWNIEDGESISICGFEMGVRSISEIRMDGTFACGSPLGEVFFVKIHNLPLGNPIVTAYHGPDDSHAFGCPYCRTWSEIPESSLGAIIPCPNCTKSVQLNPFSIEADWRPIAKAWKGE